MVKELPSGKVCWACEQEKEDTLYKCTVDNKIAWIHEMCWVFVTPSDLRYLLPSHIKKKYHVGD